jgi:dsRNA-specific ribonuclease
VLDFLTGDYLYHRFPELQERELANLRSALSNGKRSPDSPAISRSESTCS